LEFIGVGVEHAAQVARLVGDDPDGAAVEPSQRAHDVARPARGDLERPPAVDERARDFADVVDLAVLGRHDRVGREAGRVDHRPALRRL
jgi:hypothetical protein